MSLKEIGNLNILEKIGSSEKRPKDYSLILLSKSELIFLEALLELEIKKLNVIQEGASQDIISIAELLLKKITKKIK